MTNEYEPHSPLEPTGDTPQEPAAPDGGLPAPASTAGSLPSAAPAMAPQEQPEQEQKRRRRRIAVKIAVIVLLILLLLTSCLCWGRMGSIGTGAPVEPGASLPGDTVIIDPGPAVVPSASPAPSASPRPAGRRPKASPTPLPAVSPVPGAGGDEGEFFRVTFYLNYPGAPAGAYAAINVAPGALCAMPATPSRSDAFFSGWNSSPGGGGAEFNGSAPITGDLTLYAQWLTSPFDVQDTDNPSWNEISSGGEPTSIDLFRDSQARNNMIVTDERYGIIAPGSSGAYELNVVNGSRVDCEYLIQLVETLPQQNGGASFLSFKLLRGGALQRTSDAQGNEHFTVAGGSYIAGSASQYVSAADVNRAFSAYVPLAASSASLRTTHSYILLWDWPYNAAGTDERDTALGQAAAKGLLEDYLLQVTVEGRVKTG